MKNRMTMLITVLLFVVITFKLSAQEIQVKNEPVRFQKILDKALLPSLESKISGIVEGSLYNIVLCRKYFSTLDYSSTIDKLKILITENKSPQISYKAHLTLLYLSNAENITITPKTEPDSYDYIFRQLSKELETKMLVTADVLTQN